MRCRDAGKSILMLDNSSSNTTTNQTAALDRPLESFDQFIPAAPPGQSSPRNAAILAGHH